MTDSLIAIEIPAEFVKLAGDWYSGMDKLYAIASTGGLSLGTCRPWKCDEDRPMTDHEWHVCLWDRLADDIGLCLAPTFRTRDWVRAEKRLRRFLAFATKTRDMLAREYGIDA